MSVGARGRVTVIEGWIGWSCGIEVVWRGWRKRISKGRERFKDLGAWGNRAVIIIRDYGYFAMVENAPCARGKPVAMVHRFIGSEYSNSMNIRDGVGFR